MTLQSLCERLSASRTLTQFQAEVESLAPTVAPVSDVGYFAYSPDTDKLVGKGQTIDVGLSTQQGQCAFYREKTIGGNIPNPFLPASEESVCVPVRHFGSLVGVLSFSLGPEQQLSASFERFLALVGMLQEQVVANEEHTAFTERSRDLMVLAVEALASRPNHIGRVSRLCTELAALLDLSAQAKSGLFQAAQYHDVGMLALQQSSRKDAQRAHCEVGAEFLRSSRNLSYLADLVEHHHERYDGTGFPHGCSGDDLPIDCWVLALAEHLDEFWQFQSQMAPEQKLRLFFEKEAIHHHPEVLDALCGLVDSERFFELLGCEAMVIS